MIPPMAQQNANNTKSWRNQRYRHRHMHKHWKSRYSHVARLCADTTKIVPDEYIATRDSQQLISFRSHELNQQRVAKYKVVSNKQTGEDYRQHKRTVT